VVAHIKITPNFIALVNLFSSSAAMLVIYAGRCALFQQLIWDGTCMSALYPPMCCFGNVFKNNVCADLTLPFSQWVATVHSHAFATCIFDQLLYANGRRKACEIFSHD